MRARAPDVQGHVDQAGVRIGYEVYGTGSPTLLLLPTWTIVHSRLWKAQVPYLARHYRVVVFDGPGNGRSDRPLDPAAYQLNAEAGAALAVLDASGTDQAVVVSLSKAASWSLQLAADHPERVLGQVFIDPTISLAAPTGARAKSVDTFYDEIEDPRGWEKYNAHYWRHHYRDFAEFFFAQCFPEAHSTKQREDTVGWALETTPEVLLTDARAAIADPETVLAWCARVNSPVLVIHGGDDRISPPARGEALAAATDGELIVLEGAGHIPLARDPVIVNRAITQFVERVRRSPQTPTRRAQSPDAAALPRHVWTRGARRSTKVLYLSSPIGLGHARRDLAIAEQLRAHRPDIQIDWLTQQPVIDVVEAAGETIHPASAWLASESAHIASEAAGHDLHCFQALRRMDEILVANFMLFQEVVEDGLYDLVLGDEAWDVDHFWHENPELKRSSHVWLTDFVGYLPMPDGGEHEAYLTADYNAEMIEHIDRFPRIRDRAIFVGNASDVVPDVFGPGLPKIRDWTQDHFDFSGYITGFTPPTPDQRTQWREDLGYGPDEQICLVTVGGSGVGTALLELAIAAFPIASSVVPGLRMVVVAGPRIDPARLPTRAGLDIRGYVSDLHRHLSVCDLAIVQGGLTTTMELTAAQRPFLYFPLAHHFEQTYHVRHRLDQYGAGRCMDYAATDPDALADAIAIEIGRDVDVRPVETGGAERAAAMIAELL